MKLPEWVRSFAGEKSKGPVQQRARQPNRPGIRPPGQRRIFAAIDPGHVPPVARDRPLVVEIGPAVISKPTRAKGRRRCPGGQGNGIIEKLPGGQRIADIEHQVPVPGLRGLVTEKNKASHGLGHRRIICR